jgi:hypothetical protein
MVGGKGAARHGCWIIHGRHRERYRGTTGHENGHGRVCDEGHLDRCSSKHARTLVSVASISGQAHMYLSIYTQSQTLYKIDLGTSSIYILIAYHQSVTGIDEMSKTRRYDLSEARCTVCLLTVRVYIMVSLRVSAKKTHHHSQAHCGRLPYSFILGGRRLGLTPQHSPHNSFMDGLGPQLICKSCLSETCNHRNGLWEICVRAPTGSQIQIYCRGPACP